MLTDATVDRLHRMISGADLPGSRYELLSVLGRGGMAVVYQARDTVLDRVVALKVLDAAVDSLVASRLAREARILARLEHPGIVPVHDYGQLADGRWFYAMKAIRGKRLDRWATRADGLHERLAVFLRICEAVAFAHAQGVIHRDLKPENVMVGEFGEVLVLDWGIARLQPATPAHSLVQPPTTSEDTVRCGRESSEGPPAGRERAAFETAQGTVLGTPAYMAPEQARGEPAVDERADVFSLGRILEGLVEARKPLRAVAAKASSTDPAARYGDVGALAADVSRFMAGRPVEALQERLADRLARFARRYRLPIVLVLTYLAMRLLLLAFWHI